MYISDKILTHGKIQDNCSMYIRQFVVIRAKDYPNEPGMRRTTYSEELSNAVWHASRNDFSYSSNTSSMTGYFIGVEVDRLREFRPSWCITEDELLSQFEAMQREDGSGPIKNLDLRKDPELLKIAKQLWADRLSMLSKT
jgi:hypothetical protein